MLVHSLLLSLFFLFFLQLLLWILKHTKTKLSDIIYITALSFECSKLVVYKEGRHGSVGNLGAQDDCVPPQGGFYLLALPLQVDQFQRIDGFDVVGVTADSFNPPTPPPLASISPFQFVVVPQNQL